MTLHLPRFKEWVYRKNKGAVDTQKNHFGFICRLFHAQGRRTGDAAFIGCGHGQKGQKGQNGFSILSMLFMLTLLRDMLIASRCHPERSPLIPTAFGC
jgi:hypothetical protein